MFLSAPLSVGGERTFTDHLSVVVGGSDGIHIFLRERYREMKS